MYPVGLIRWAGLLALMSGILFAAVDFFDLLDLAFSDESDSEAITTLSEQLGSALAPVAGVLLLLGLVGLFAAQSEAAGTLGLAGFLLTFCGGVLGHHSSVSWPLAQCSGMGHIRGIYSAGPSLLSPARRTSHL